MKIAAYLQAILARPILLVFLCAALAAAVAAIPLYAYSSRPRSGSIEWIHRFDTGRFAPLQIGKFTHADLIWALVAALCAAALRLFFLLAMLLRSHPTDALATLLGVAASVCLHYLLPAALLGLGIYLLLRALSCATLAAVCAGVLGGVLQIGWLWPAVFACYALLFVYLWMCADPKATLFFNAVWLLLSGCCCVLCILLCHRAVWLLPLYLGAYVFTQCYRWRGGDPDTRLKKLLLSLLLCALGAVFLLLVLWAMFVLRTGAMTGGIHILRSFRFYQSLVPELLTRLRNLLSLPPPQNAVVFFDVFSFLAGSFACLCLLHMLVRRRDNASALILALLVPFVLLWLLGGAYLLSLVLLLALGRLWSRYCEQRHGGFAVASAVALGGIFYGALFLI